ncbi:MAG: Hsp20/alpha crystallin family protein [Saprospiraceae bacterium]|nr:Hsp20/alpha crystallin family protein [Saprospiraceae bacterium]
MWTKTMYQSKPNSCRTPYNFRPEVLISDTIPANIQKNAESFVIELSLPAYEKSEINVKIENNDLVVSTTVTEDKNNYKSKEFKKSNLKRVFRLPTSVNKDEIQASFTQGILTLTLKKLANNHAKINIL